MAFPPWTSGLSRLAVVRINGPIVLVIHQGNAVIKLKTQKATYKNPTSDVLEFIHIKIYKIFINECMIMKQNRKHYGKGENCSFFSSRYIGLYTCLKLLGEIIPVQMKFLFSSLLLSVNCKFLYRNLMIVLPLTTYN